MVAISIDRVSKQFPARSGPTTAVDDVSLSIAGGSLFFLLGPSGCGKTTLLRMIAGFTFPSAGRILFDQQDISVVPPHQRDTGMVFQSYALWPHMSVAENVAFGLDSRKIRNPERANRIRESLAMVQMESLADRRPNQLSGGQQQRVALARALAIRPKCLLLDEPLSNLDAKLRLDMRAEIRRIVKQSGITTIYVTHDQKEALSMADTIALLRAGKLEQTGTPLELYRRPATRFVADFIGESNFLNGTVDSINSATILVKTAAGPVMAAPRKDLAVTGGKAVTLAFRPESLTIAGPQAGPSGATVNRLRGKRLSTTYMGEAAEHLIALPGVQPPIKAVELNPRASELAGPADITLLLAQDQVMILNEAD